MGKKAQKIVATIMGCGSSGGVPRVGNLWGACDPNEPKNRRRRCSLLLTGTREDSEGQTIVVIDTGCDLREQLLDADVRHIEGVFYTHEHADHTHGIDDLRALALSNKKRIDVYFGARAGVQISEKFSYCFSSPKNSEYPPILRSHRIFPGEPVEIEGEGGTITLLPILQQHGSITTLGFRIGDFMYSCDVSGFDAIAQDAMGGLNTWVVDALRPTAHPSHLSLPESLDWIERMAPTRAVLTNLHNDMDYHTISAQTPDNVVLAYDGMELDVTGV